MTVRRSGALTVYDANIVTGVFLTTRFQYLDGFGLGTLPPGGGATSFRDWLSGSAVSPRARFLSRSQPGRKWQFTTASVSMVETREHYEATFGLPPIGFSDFQRVPGGTVDSAAFP